MFLFKRAENETSYSDGTRAHVLITNGKESTDREYIKVMTAQGNKPTEQEAQRDLVQNAPRPFRFLR
jgi:hypothetical protein